MRILILGGTRFMGRALANLLPEFGHDVTVSSRHIDGAPKNVCIYSGEREESIISLGKEKPFDIVIDFTAYHANSVKQALKTFPNAFYFLISSIWVTRFCSGLTANMPIPVGIAAPVDLPELTRQYMVGKAGAEDVVFKAYSQGLKAVSLRLPILVGFGDHTGRIDFYRRRLNDGEKLILVDGGTNHVQLIWSEDVAAAIARLLEMNLKDIPPIVEGLPKVSFSVLDFIKLVANAGHLNWHSISVPKEILSRDFSIFLDREPLWRECALPISDTNLFEITGWKLRSADYWLAKLIQQEHPCSDNDDLRRMELDFIRGFTRS